ncbi:MAG: mannitol-1-phosphate 5-dehydrogenase [Luteococcus sp.]|uniref:mannitol-1-phosphate 5-dehydrogenase n=1 Tax=Luteococcus sp. TaxID=1969402 RepID=UPI0026472FAB|nr:mannitol-1-phosphate 5-dehydrogenase [Luteococcus sp.]MDN5564716.1 mannitol-1-phosphate 5-dehydrogenase [Luteococcus sp.]
MKKAVHFGAGNIGRGFVGLLLNEGGYQLTFADVSDALIDQLKAADSYTVHEVGDGGKDHVISGFEAINSKTEADALTAAIAEADVVTCAVGPNILKFIAPAIRAGIDARPADAPKIAVMACENAINATDGLKGFILGDNPADVEAKAVFANTAVDRIVPNQPEGMGLDVNVEPYFEWAIEEPAFGGDKPEIPGATWVESLAPYIERKLFTVNTGHAATAYFGYGADIEKISDVLAQPELKDKIYQVLAETKALLVAKYGFEPEVQEAYVQKILKRFANPELPDTVTRVGRSPLRKLSRHERFVGPAAELAERGMESKGLQAAMLGAMLFDVAEDAEAVTVGEILAANTPEAAVSELTGLDTSHPLFAQLVEVATQGKAQRA